MRGPRVTINATVLAAAVGIDAGVEADVRAVVVGQDAGGAVVEKLRARPGMGFAVLGVRIPFEVEGFEAIGRIGGGAAPLNHGGGRKNGVGIRHASSLRV